MRKLHLRKTRNTSSKKLDLVMLGVIIAVAAGLRLWATGQTSSANGGLMSTLPFAVLGVCSVYLIYILGRQWFNRKAGMLSAAFFAVSQFTVLHSLATWPYSVGLFFVLLTAWFWHKIVFELREPKAATYIGFALSAWAASSVQYFSLAQAVLIFATGLFFLPKSRRKPYWLSGLGTLVLLASTLPFTYRYLLGNGNIGAQPSAPNVTFFTDFLQYTMNDASLFMFTVGIVILLPLILGKRNRSRNPLRWVGIAWFGIIFVFAFIYSMLCKPVLDYNMLVFSYPFLIMTAFSLFRNRTLSPWQNALVVAALLFAGLSSLIL